MFGLIESAPFVRSAFVGMFATLAFVGTTTAGQARKPLLVFEVQGAGEEQGLGTFPRAINGRSVVTGNIRDSEGLSHGFFGLAQGPITVFDVATGASAITYPVGINDVGTILGVYAHDGIAGVFLRTSNGAIETFGDSSYSPRAINNNGVVTGNIINPQVGFVRAIDGTVTKFSAYAGSTFTTPLAINSHGVIAGVFGDSETTHSFIRYPNGRIVTFDVPGNDQTYITGIDSEGDVVGGTHFPDGGTRAFLRTKDGTITTFVPPGCTYANPVGINFARVIVGTCAANPKTLGFTRWPDGTTVTYGARPDAQTIPVAINPAGKSIGFVIDNNGVFHGYRLNSLNEPAERPH